MENRNLFVILGILVVASASVSADIVWSGDQNLTGDFQYIDLNSDNLIDVALIYSVSGDPSVDSGLLSADVSGSINGSSRILKGESMSYGAALTIGTLISSSPSPSLEWDSFEGTVSRWVKYNPDFPGPPLESDENWRGPLGDNGNTFIGIEFEVDGASHYGWVNIALGSEEYLGFKDPVTISWAYESNPNTAIVAGAIPEPSTGILTMVGSFSLLMLTRSRYRRRRKQRNEPLQKCHVPSAQTTTGEW